MKEKVVRATFWSISIMIGLSIVSLIKGNSIDIIYLLISGGIVGVLDYLIQSFNEKRKKKKE